MAGPEPAPLADVRVGLDPTSPSPLTRPTRPTRGTTPSGRVQDTLRSLESATARASKRISLRTTRAAPVSSESEKVSEVKPRSNGETAKIMLARILEVIGKMSGDIGELKTRVSEQNDMIRKLSATVYKQSTIIQGQEELLRELEYKVQESSAESRRKHDEYHQEMKGEHQDLQREFVGVKEQLVQLMQKPSVAGEATGPSGHRTTFADIARSLPVSPPTSVRSVPGPTKQQTAGDSLHCSIDMSRVNLYKRSL